jgi:hypothetical protein
VKGKNESDDKSYNISGSVDKGAVKEAVQGIVEGVSQNAPTVIGGFADAKVVTAVVKACGKIPPVQKAILGVTTAAIGALGGNSSNWIG